MCIPWGIKVQRYLQHAQYVLLSNDKFVEVRHIRSGRLVQIIIGQDIRILSCAALPNSPTFVAKRGKVCGHDGQTDDMYVVVLVGDSRT